MKMDEKNSPTIDGLLRLTSPLHHDERGYFLENWRKIDLINFGVLESFFQGNLQNNVSLSKKRNDLRDALLRLGEVDDRCFRYVSYVFYRFTSKFSNV